MKRGPVLSPHGRDVVVGVIILIVAAVCAFAFGDIPC
ncbi:hypothetical protein KOAAANKH_00127 [Brevundimonas sp. NIBR10]|nr:hypothetical protein KOAAANKH_00127 [Brevundimonas sp. NIBR10]